MFKSLRTKLVCVFAGFLVVFVLLQLLFNVFFAEKIYISRKKSEITQVYTELKNNYSDNHDDIYSILSKYEEKYNIRAVIFSKDSELMPFEIVYSNLPDWQIDRRNFMRIPREIAENRASFSENAEAVLAEHFPNDMKNLFLSGLIKTENGDRYVMLESPVASIKQSVMVSNTITLWLLLFLVILGMICFYIFAYRLTKPIKDVDAVAQSVVNLDFSKTAEETGGKDEIAHLASNINIMSERISGMITELKEANSKLSQEIEYKTKLENIRKEFVANVSHELKTPIALLMGYAEMLKTDMPGIDKEFYYDVIIDESEKMNKLVRQLLDISAMENEIYNLKCEAVKLKEMTLWILEKNKIHIEKNRHMVEFHGEELTAFCDKMKIEQCITNYITNAIFHSKEGSRIEIKLYKEDDNAVLSVFNEGSHIEEAELEKIWNIFYKADKSRTERSSTGLGLYIVSSVINAHKGEYGVKNLDSGVEFYFKIKINC